MSTRRPLTRDRLGARRIFVDVASGKRAADLHGLLSLVPAARRGGLDVLGIEAALGLVNAPARTCLAAVRAVPPASARPRASSCPSPRPHPRLRSALGESLVAAALDLLAGARHPVVALGGGLDAPLAVLAARRAGIVIEHALHVFLPGTSYDEVDAARETAEALSLSLHEIPLTASELASALPHAVRLAETPLYNLHPVSRAVLARVARTRGHDMLVTGDGADQAARGATEPADYVPIVAAITRATGIGLAAPFVDEEVVELVVAAADPDKRILRELAIAWGLPSAIANRPKIPCFAPPLPRQRFPEPAALAHLATLLARTSGFTRPLAWSADDRLNVGLASLAAFVRVFEIEAG